MGIGQELQLVARIEPTNATNQKLRWESSHVHLVSVTSEGLIRAIAVGKATITVRSEDGGHQAMCTIQVIGASVDDVEGEEL